MEPIPRPQPLDVDRPLRKRGPQFEQDERPDIEVVEEAFKQTGEYANALWNQLEAVRTYLMDSLPAPDAGASGAPGQPVDRAAWERWVAIYADVVSVLCGPKGDNGFGREEALVAAQRRGVG